MIEYKFCYDGKFEFWADFDRYLEFGRYLNENVIHQYDYDTLNLHLQEMYNKFDGYAFFKLAEHFTRNSLPAQAYYPEELSKIEKYYFGATENIFSYKEAFFADYISCYAYSKIRIEDFIKGIEGDIEISRSLGKPLVVLEMQNE